MPGSDSNFMGTVYMQNQPSPSCILITVNNPDSLNLFTSMMRNR